MPESITESSVFAAQGRRGNLYLQSLFELLGAELHAEEGVGDQQLRLCALGSHSGKAYSSTN